ncbi:MAG: phospho-N-acetylmuramoyl-pentapeptide-transferase, partial [Planctomycetota bacterium]|nr:phospho-N-acetylmuramoyl-pentapeptide-transferase [Planctomycetota bacterium]
MLLNIFPDDFFALITFRAAMAGVVAFLASLILGPRVIRWLKNKKIGENVEKDDSRRLDQLMKSKQDTPTMGGIFVIAGIIISVLLFGNFVHPTLFILVFTVVSLGIVGAVDDWMKLSGKRQGGMRASLKLGLQATIGLAVGVMLYLVMLREDPEHASRFYILFDGYIELGWFYPVMVSLVIVSTSNAVNITDGLDGLAGGCLAISTLAYTFIAYIVGRVDFTAYLGIPYVALSAETTVFCTAMLGATLGFLWFNSHPAQVFMGDSGSLPLGGALGLVACITKQEMLLFLVGGIFVIEAGSSLLQILSFKLTGKRIFRIAPLHHHFQFKGVQESKITMRFWIV